jgi:hypothetical protein
MGFREDIGVFVVQSDSTSIKLALAKIEEILPMKDFKGVEKPRRCGRFEGAEITAEQPMPTGIVVNLYEVAVLANLKLYIAAYTRPMDAKDDDKAIQAVNSLCENPLFGGVASL